MWINFSRIAQNSWKSFTRNLWLSLATFGMMALALSIIGFLVLFNASVNVFAEGLRNRVDVSVYFDTNASEQDIMAVKQEIERRPEVREVSYVSRDEALDTFRQENANNEVLLESLQELENNPLQASLGIRVFNIKDFPTVQAAVQSSPNASLIDKINYQENEFIINRINDIASNISTAGAIFTIALGIFVFLVTYNTIRLAIYTARDEIHIMKLVGASNWFVRGPFILTGALYGIVSSIITIVFLVGATWLLGERVPLVFAEIDLFGYLLSNFVWVFLMLLSIGLMLGMLSSYVAVRRYLRV